MKYIVNSQQATSSPNYCKRRYNLQDNCPHKDMFGQDTCGDNIAQFSRLNEEKRSNKLSCQMYIQHEMLASEDSTKIRKIIWQLP